MDRPVHDDLFMYDERWETCIRACDNTASESERCIAKWLAEEDVENLAECIARARDVVDSTKIAAQWMARGSEHASTMARICAQICEDCAVECDNHKEFHASCASCAESCRRCAHECRNAADRYYRERIAASSI
jgi:hypothetical protein